MEEMGMLLIRKIRLMKFMSSNITSLIYIKRNSSHICTDWLYFLGVCLKIINQKLKTISCKAQDKLYLVSEHNKRIHC